MKRSAIGWAFGYDFLPILKAVVCFRKNNSY